MKFNYSNETLLPTTLAFEYCGDQDALKLAKSGATIVIRSLQRLFETDADNKSFTQADVEKHARAIYGPMLDMDAFSLGLCLIGEFGVLKACGYNSANELVNLDVADNIVTFDQKKIENAWNEHVFQRSRYLERGPETLENEYERETMTTSNPDEVTTSSTSDRFRELMHNPAVIVAIVGAIATILVAIIQIYPALRHGSITQVNLHIAGTVVDADTNVGIGQAQIILSGRTEAYVTEDNGNFRIDITGSEDEARRLRVRVNKRGYKPYDQSVIPPLDSLIVQLQKL